MPTQTTPGWSAAARSTKRQSSTVVHSGFSIITWRSRPKTSSSTSRCVWFGVATITASSGASSSIARASSKSATSGPPVSRAHWRERSCGSATAVTSASSIRRRFSMCSMPIIPLPTMPTRSGAAMVSSS